MGRTEFLKLQWLGRDRVNAYAVILALCSLVSMWWMVGDALQPGGSDFIAFWSASRMLIEGQAAGIYSPTALGDIQLQVARADVVPFVHPPQFLFAIWPLGYLAYPMAWLGWTGVTYGLWLCATRRLYPSLSWPIAAFPGALVAAWHAQTGFLTSAIQALVAGLLRDHPFRAGLCIGLLIIKPHLAVLVPFALLAARSWLAILGAIASILATALASWGVFGSAVWLAYPSSWPVSQYLMETGGDVFFLRQVTVYAIFRVWGMPEVAVFAQAITTIAAIAAVWKVWSRDIPIEGKIALLFALTPLATPYLFSYDLPFLAIPVCWLITHYNQPWSRPVLVALYLSPLVCRAMALPIWFNATPLACIAMAALIYRLNMARATAGAGAGDAASDAASPL